jgi:hypothetical protein
MYLALGFPTLSEQEVKASALAGALPCFPLVVWESNMTPSHTSPSLFIAARIMIKE